MLSVSCGTAKEIIHNTITLGEASTKIMKVTFFFVSHDSLVNFFEASSEKIQNKLQNKFK